MPLQVAENARKWRHVTDSWLALSDVLTIDYDDLWSLDCRQLVRIAEHLRWPLIRDEQLKYTLDSSSFGDLGMV